jgi:hypothetical protein
MQYSTNPTHPNFNPNNTYHTINSNYIIPNKNHNKNYSMILTKITNKNVIQQLSNKFLKI